MSTASTTTQARAQNTRGRGAQRGRRGRGGQKNGAPRDPAQISKADLPAAKSEAQINQNATSQEVSNGTDADAESVDESTICWICAEPVKYWSLSECNHRTCHVCALRLRALYKKLECTFCKVRNALSVALGVHDDYECRSSLNFHCFALLRVPLPLASGPDGCCTGRYTVNADSHDLADRQSS